MRELAIACGIGAVSGSRTMLGPALVARRVLPPAARRLVETMAAGELVADKSSRIGNRTDALPLAGRVIMGAIAAGAYAPRRRRMRAALMGAAGALVGTYAWYHLRHALTTRLGATNAVSGLLEDALAMGAGAAMLRR
jgi:uncharacterized membrane protein